MLVCNSNYLQIFSFSSTKYYRFLCNIVLYSIRLYFHHQSHPQLGFALALAQPLNSFWSCFSNGILAPTNLGSSSYRVIFLPLHTVHGVLKERMLKWFAIPFSSGPHFIRPLHHDPSVLGGPTWHGS